MKQVVRLFSVVRELAGSGAVEVDLPDPATAADAAEAVAVRVPTVRPHLARLRIAVNHAYVSPDHPLRPGDEVALIPPVSGGLCRPGERSQRRP